MEFPKSRTLRALIEPGGSSALVTESSGYGEMKAEETRGLGDGEALGEGTGEGTGEGDAEEAGERLGEGRGKSWFSSSS